jgi:glycosyltransferase involved in cell wall biosynthesis
MQSLDAVFPVSQIGADYLISRYPMAKTKVKSIFLGTEDPIFTNPFDPDNFILVSCASIRYKKRIHAIAEALSHMTIPLIWYHFGDENLESNDPSIPEYLRMRETLKLNSNIHYRPMGQTDNKLLFNFYRNNSISLFISLSETEGIPVSIMEAISFGIPVLSTDVGGCREIVNNTTGILIPLDTDAKAVATKLTEFKDSEANTLSFRQGVRKFWENHFDAQKNYSYFFEEIKSISNDQ